MPALIGALGGVTAVSVLWLWVALRLGLAGNGAALQATLDAYKVAIGSILAVWAIPGIVHFATSVFNFVL